MSTVILNKLPPQAKKLEEAVLGAMLLDKRIIDVVSPILGWNDFYYEPHQSVYKAILELHKEEGAQIDMLTVEEKLKGQGLIDHVGGAYFLVELTSKVASGANAEYHSLIILQKSLLREVIELCSRCLQEASNDTVDVFELLGNLANELTRINTKVGDPTPRIETHLDQLHAKAKEIHESGGRMIGEYFSGMDHLDETIGGLRGDSLVAVGGRPASGKSSFLNSVIVYHVKNQIPLYMWSGEMGIEQTLARGLSAVSGIPVASVEMGDYMGSTTMYKQYEAADELFRASSERLFLEKRSLSVDKLKSHIVQYKEKGCQTYCIDRLGLMQEVQKGRNIAERVGISLGVCEQLRSVCNEYQVNIILLSQLSSDIERRANKYPQMVDFFGAIAIQSSATVAMAVYRPEMYHMAEFPVGEYEGESSKGKAELVILKNNHGATNKGVLVNFSKKLCWFSPFDDGSKMLYDEDVEPEIEGIEEDLPF